MTSVVTGVVDLQVNGYAGLDFNADQLSERLVNRALDQLEQDGVAGILATVITDRLPSMCRRLANIAELVRRDSRAEKLIRGIHIEGPFISPEPGYVGAHPADCVVPATVKDMQTLLQAAEGLTRLVTLAPEADVDCHVIRFLAQEGIKVSAGHTNANMLQLKAAIDSGLSVFTHLGNGCPMLMHRHDNIIQRALSCSDRLMIGLIADGIHVPWLAFQNYLAAASIDRCYIVTDAISAAGMGAGIFSLAGQDVIVDESGATWAADRSHLVGSAITMPIVAANLKHHLKLTDDQVQQLLVRNPARILND